MDPFSSFNAASKRQGSGINAPLNDKGETALHLASARGDHADMDRLIKASASVHQQDDSGKTPLFTAIEKQDLAAIDRLIAAGARWRQRDDARRLPLEAALFQKEATPDFLRALHARGAFFDAPGEPLSDALHLVIEAGRPDLIDCLAEPDPATGFGLDVNRANALGATPLHAATAKGDHDGMRRLLARDADANIRDAGIRTPLHVAAERGDEAAAGLLLALPEVIARINDFKTYHDGFTPLLMAAENGHAGLLRKLAKAGADVNARDSDKRSALFIAAQKSDPETVRALIELGADVSKDKNRGGARNDKHIMHVIGDDHYAQVLLLLQAAGIDLDARDASGQTALHLACEADDPARACALLNLGADPNLMNEFGKRPIDCVMEHYFYVHKSHLTILARLLACGADPNLSPDARVAASPLAAAARGDDPQAVRLLLDHRAHADLPERGKEPQTPFMAACAFGRLENAQILVREGAHILKRDEQMRTALHHAAERGEKTLTEWLLALPGFSPDLRDAQGKTALHYAAIAGKKDVVDALIDGGADPRLLDEEGWSPLHYAVRDGHEPVVAALLPSLIKSGGIDIPARESLETPLHIAARRGYGDVIDTLLANGADASLRSGAGHVPLHHAIFGNRALAAEKLLSALKRRKADVNKIRDRNGNTLLHFAAARDAGQLPKLLIAAGCDINAENGEGSTALHFATAAGRLDTVHCLVDEKGALQKPNRQGRTPLMIAQDKKNEDMIRCLQEALAEKDPQTANDNTDSHEKKSHKKPLGPSAP